MPGPNPALFGIGAVALLLLSRKRDDGSAGDSDHPAWANCHAHSPAADGESLGDIIKMCESPEGRPLLGKLYQAVDGDNPIVVARKALYGSGEPRLDPRERQAVIDLAVRMDCGPWNQTVNGAEKAELGPGHHAAERGYTDKGILFQPRFPNNRERLLSGKAPRVGTGTHFPYMWIPMIDLDKFMTTGEVTTLGQDYPEDENGGSYNMIDPPPWVIDLQFEGELKTGTVGCELPEGDFSQIIELDDES